MQDLHSPISFLKIIQFLTANFLLSFQVVQKTEKEAKKDEGKKKDVQATKRQSVKDLANKLKSQVHDGPPMLRKKGNHLKCSLVEKKFKELTEPRLNQRSKKKCIFSLFRLNCG